MESSYVQFNSEMVYQKEESTIKLPGRIAIAVAIIILVGSLIANGCLYSQLHAYSFAIGGSGVGLFLILMFMGCNNTTKVTVARQEDSQVHPPPRKDTEVESSEPPIQEVQKDKKKPPQTSTTTTTTTTTAPTTTTTTTTTLSTTTTTTAPTTTTTLSTTTTSSAPKKFNQPPKKNPRPVKSSTSTSSPPPVKTTSQPLLPIFGIQLDPKHVLLKEISPISFLKKAQKNNTDAVNFALATMGRKYEVDTLALDSRFDNDLLNFPLEDWINKQSSLGNSYATFSKDPERKANVIALDERINCLEQLIQLKERLKRRPCEFKMRHLLGDWLALRCRFMMEAEFLGLTVASIRQEKDPSAVENLLGERIRARSQETPTFTLPTSLDKKSVDDILLSDLPKIQAAHINATPEHFPLLTFLLMDLNELKKIELKKLSDEQLEFVLSKDTIKSFTSQQINSVISKVRNPMQLFTRLSADQKADFDFFQITNTVQRESIFGLVNAELFEKMELKRIYELMPLFKTMHWKELGNVEEHVIAFDFNQIADVKKKKHVFQCLYDCNDMKRCFAKQDLNRIYDFLPWFDNKHWNALGDLEDYVLAFDYSRIDTSKRLFVCLVWFPPLYINPSIAPRRLDKLKSSQKDKIRDYVDKGLLKYLN